MESNAFSNYRNTGVGGIQLSVGVRAATQGLERVVDGFLHSGTTERCQLPLQVRLGSLGTRTDGECLVLIEVATRVRAVQVCAR